MTQERESRPVGGNQAAEISSGDTHSIPAGTDDITAAALVAGVHVVVVETPAGRYRRRVYLSLDSAQKAADRAAMAGHPASVILCQLVPAGGAA